MSKRGTNIYKRKDGRWEGRYTKGFDDMGRRIWGSVYGKTYKEALSKKIKAQLAYANWESGLEDPPFQYVAECWFESRKNVLKPSSREKYERLLNLHILPDLGKYKCSQLTPELLNQYIIKKQSKGKLHTGEGLSQRTVSNIYSLIKEIAKYAEITNHIYINVNCVTIQKLKPKQGNVFSADSLEKLKCAVEEEYHGDLRCLGIFVCMYTGLRIGELCALKWSDIDLENNMIYVTRTLQRLTNTSDSSTKTHICEGTPKTITSKREIPICSVLARALGEHDSLFDKNAYLLSGSPSKCIEPRNLQYYFKRFQLRHNIDPLNCHALRHTFATTGISSGIDVKTVSELLGHSNVNITLNYYVHTSMEQKRKQIEFLSYS